MKSALRSACRARMALLPDLSLPFRCTPNSSGSGVLRSASVPPAPPTSTLAAVCPHHLLCPYSCVVSFPTPDSPDHTTVTFFPLYCNKQIPGQVQANALPLSHTLGWDLCCLKEAYAKPNAVCFPAAFSPISDNTASSASPSQPQCLALK